MSSTLSFPMTRDSRRLNYRKTRDMFKAVASCMIIIVILWLVSLQSAMKDMKGGLTLPPPGRRGSLAAEEGPGPGRIGADDVGNPHTVPWLLASSSSVLTCQTRQPKRTRQHTGERTHEYKINYEYQKVENENDSARAKSFAKIYEKNSWGGGEVIDGTKFGGSGPGSLMASTVEVRKTLDVAIETVKLALGKDRISMLDIPCGDMVWMKHYMRNRTDVDYTGMDIVGSLINHHEKTFQNSSWKFKQHDIVKDPVNQNFDLIFSRQMTQHLGTEDTMRVLKHFSDGASYLLITNYLDTKSNIRLDTRSEWRFRHQNLELAPYSITQPICEDEEKGCVNAFYSLPLHQWY